MRDDLYTEEGLTRAVREASEAGRELETGEARAVASAWHSGQFSEFYKFASSGHFDREGLSRELSDTIAGAYRGASPNDKLALDMMGTYILNREEA